MNDRLTVTAVGFGKAGNGNVGEGDQDDLKRGMWNRLDGLNVRRGFSDLAGYVSDFDKNDAEHNRLDSVDFPGGFAATQRSDRTWLKLEGSLASGDSGGGLFAELGGRDVIIGIASGVTSFAPIELFRYGSYSHWTPIDENVSDFINRTTRIEPVPEPSSLAASIVALLGLFARKCMTRRRDV